MSSWRAKGERTETQGDLGHPGQGRGPLLRPRSPHSHVGLVVLPDLLDAHIILGVNEGLSSGVRLGQGHDTCDILEVMLVVHLDLWEWGGDQGLGRVAQQWAVGLPKQGHAHK